MTTRTPPAPPSAPLGEMLRRPGVRPAMLAALASFGVMVSVMNLSGYVIVEHQHHEQHDVFPVIGAHVFGMYALVLVVGSLIDRIGRMPALFGGLLIMAASTIGLLWAEGVFVTAVLLFGLGVGWNLSFVAATAQLADATSASERGRLLGFNDTLSALLGAALALLGGYALDSIGVDRPGARRDGDRRRAGALAPADVARLPPVQSRAVTRVAEAVGQALARAGADVVFGVMGSGNLSVTNALVEAGVPFHAARHEGGAICMADGYARVSGRLAVCSVHQGPGLTNAITGLTEAAKSRTPLIVLAADTPAAALRSNFRIDQDALVESVGAVAERVHGPGSALADVARAVRRAREERRAVVLMLPLDVQAAEAAGEPPPAAPGAGPAAPRRGRRRRGRRAAGGVRAAGADRGPRRGARRGGAGAPRAR